MRGLVTSLILVSASSLKVCGSDGSGPKASASADVALSASGSAAATLSKIKARIGGRVVAVGDHAVELVVHQAGLVEALVFDSGGQLLSDGVSLRALVSTKSHGKEAVALGFSAPSARFEGHAKAGVELATGPLELTLTLSGKALEAKLETALAMRSPEFGGHMLSVGAHSAELLVRSDGEVLAFLRDASGAAVHAQAGLDVNASVQASGDARESLQLSFDPIRHCFSGHAKAGVTLAPGPVELSIGGKAGIDVGRLDGIALRVDASHGGQVLLLGNYSVELVAQGKAIQAFVLDAAGKATLGADASLKLGLGALSTPDLSLSFDPASSSYKGEFTGGADVHLQPIRVTLDVAGRAFVGAAASLSAVGGLHLDPPSVNVDANLAARSKLGADAKVGADAKLGVDAKLALPDVKAKLQEAEKSANAAAQVKVTPPKVNVEKSASASAGTKAGSAKASAGFSFGLK